MNKANHSWCLLCTAGVVALLSGCINQNTVVKTGPKGWDAHGGHARAKGLVCPKAVLKHKKMLKLTPEQVKKLEQLVADFKKGMMPLKLNKRRLHQQLTLELMQDRPTAGKLKPLAQQIGQVKGQLLNRHVEVTLAVNGILQPDQWRRLLISSHGRGHGKAGKRGGHHGGGGCKRHHRGGGHHGGGGCRCHHGAGGCKCHHGAGGCKCRHGAGTTAKQPKP